mgnify:CR=1 FL=1
MGRMLYIALALLAFSQSQHAMADEMSDQIRTNLVASEIRRFMNTQAKRSEGALTALTLSIGDPETLELARAFGQARPGQTATPDTRFAIASISKSITAATILRAIAHRELQTRDGRPVELDTDIRDIFAGVGHWAREGAGAIRVRNLLTMTSNLPNFTRQPPALIDPWGSVGAERLLRAVREFQPHGWPNTFEYNNTGYFLLAEILEHAALSRGTNGSRFEAAILRTTALADMRDTHLRNAPDNPDNLAQPNYSRPRSAFTAGYWLKGSADLVSTATDLYLWNAAFMSGRIVTADMRDLMLSDQARVDPTTYYGMGWFIEHESDRDIFSHTGSVPGYTSVNMIVRRLDTARWRSVTILTNGEEVEGLDILAKDVLRVFEQRLN